MRNIWSQIRKANSHSCFEAAIFSSIKVGRPQKLNFPSKVPDLQPRVVRMMEISDQVSDLPSSLTPKVEFSISPRPRAPVPGLPAASGSAHPPCPDPVPSHPAGSSLGAQLLNSLCHYGEKFLIAGPVQIGYNDKQHKILCWIDI